MSDQPDLVRAATLEYANGYKAGQRSAAAEIARLRETDGIKQMLDEIEELRREIDRLRAALRVIANNTETDMVGDTWVTQAAMVARRALEGKDAG